MVIPWGRSPSWHSGTPCGSSTSATTVAPVRCSDAAELSEVPREKFGGKMVKWIGLGWVPQLHVDRVTGLQGYPPSISYMKGLGWTWDKFGKDLGWNQMQRLNWDLCTRICFEDRLLTTTALFFLFQFLSYTCGVASLFVEWISQLGRKAERKWPLRLKLTWHSPWK